MQSGTHLVPLLNLADVVEMRRRNERFATNDVQVQRIASRLRMAREIRGLKMNELNRRAGLAGGTVSRAESGERLPEAVGWVALADTLNCRLDWLLRGIEPSGLAPDGAPAPAPEAPAPAPEAPAPAPEAASTPPPRRDVTTGRYAVVRRR
jgi:transcriptional regulator with XRE-family HTH domain